MTKYIFVLGGVMSGVGKGIAASSIARILEEKKLSVISLKIDPYLNIDAGTMNPKEHGEVFVLADGYETDQDMGNYERFLNIDLTKKNYMTYGMVMDEILKKERSLYYKGKTVQLIPHVSDEIISRIEKAGEGKDILITEVGGTVGEYESLVFLEALRIMRLKHKNNCLFIMLTYLPSITEDGEAKTKPTQQAVRKAGEFGINIDILIARSRKGIDDVRKEKIGMFCNLEKENIISAPNVKNIYEIPINFEKENLSEKIINLLDIKIQDKKADKNILWKDFVKKINIAEGKKNKKEIKIAMIGKYFDSGNAVMTDVYLSLIEGLKYSAYNNGIKLNTEWINSKDIEKGKYKINNLKKYDGIIVPGGFGESGIEGKISAIKFAREKNIPYLGICYGMQLALIEIARNVVNLKDANTTEINLNTQNKIIDIQKDQIKNLLNNNMGGNMRLGSYTMQIKDKKSLAYKIYKKDSVIERHRHRYEFNNEYKNILEKAGVKFSGMNIENNLVEMIELNKNKFFVGVQFHPEFLARPLSPHPLFNAFLKACEE